MYELSQIRSFLAATVAGAVIALVFLATASVSAAGKLEEGESSGRNRSAAPADSSGTGPAFAPNSELDVTVPRISEPPRIDGSLDDPCWENAARLSNFCEISPGDNIEPPVRTEAFFGYDSENFYFGFICHDESPERIRASMTDRDEIFQDDFAGIMLDTFKDQKLAYEIFVNPYGIQGDLRRNYNNEDETFDMIWQSDGRINGEGWTAEAAIPFRSLRFPDTHEQEWLVHVLRIRPRDSREQHSWAPISRDESCLFCQAGTLRGMEGVNRGKNLEILPYAIANQSGGLNDEEDPRLGFSDKDMGGEAGVGVKYGITSNLTLDFTYNPDFSQVESDVAQIDVNTTFALFFPEKRPFFLEGRDIFQTENLIYTRSINDPTAAAKVTGKVGKYTLGYILARDDASPFIVPFEDNSELALGGESVSNILRVKRDLLSDSYVGLIATDRRLSDGSNSLLVLDGDVRFLENYRVSGQFGYTHTEEPDDPELSSDFADTTFGEKNHTSVFDGESFVGRGHRLNFSRSARHWNFNLWYNDLSPTFRADNGFITGNNNTETGLWTGVTFQPNNRVFETIQPQLNWGYEQNHDHVFKDTWTSPSIYVRFKKQTGIWMGYLWSRERFKGTLVEGIRRFEGDISTDATEMLSGGAYWRFGRSVARGEDPPILGHERVYEAWGTFKPTSRLNLNFNYTHARMKETASGPELYSGYVARNRLTYQFSKRLFLRLVTQYNDFSRRFEVDPLISYKINPFTVFYLGSTHDFRDFSKDEDLEGAVQGFKKTDRQFFAKIQYLFRI
jgi:hypothetical protein